MIGDFHETFWSPEPIIAYRGWTHWDLNGGLVGPHGYPWKTRTLTATHRGADHDAPQPGCNCGINAWKDPLGPRRYHILGQVSLTGNVDEYETGYRAEHAEVLAIQIYFRYESSLTAEQLEPLIETSGPFPRERVDKEIEATFGVPVTRVKRISWRQENIELDRKEQNRWPKSESQ